ADAKRTAALAGHAPRGGGAGEALFVEPDAAGGRRQRVEVVEPGWRRRAEEVPLRPPGDARLRRRRAADAVVAGVERPGADGPGARRAGRPASADGPVDGGADPGRLAARRGSGDAVGVPDGPGPVPAGRGLRRLRSGVVRGGGEVDGAFALERGRRG